MFYVGTIRILGLLDTYIYIYGKNARCFFGLDKFREIQFDGLSVRMKFFVHYQRVVLLGPNNLNSVDLLTIVTNSSNKWKETHSSVCGHVRSVK